MDWKAALGNLIDENPELNKACETLPTKETTAKKTKKQNLRVELDKRKGKLATLITEYDGNEEEVKEIAQKLKKKLGIGGSVRDGEILVQGDVRKKVAELLVEMNFKVKRIGF